MERPKPPPEAILIRLAREAAGIKAPDAAKTAGISTARWSQVETGYESRMAQYKPVHAKASTLAHMAFAVGLAPHRLEQVDRGDAAEVLREILRQHAERIKRIESENAAAGRQPITISLDGLTPDQIHLVEGIVAEMRGSGDEGEDSRRTANGA